MTGCFLTRKIDLICNTINDGKFSFAAYFNGFRYDSYFIKALNYVGKSRVSEFGTNFRFVKSLLSGERIIMNMLQSPQSGSHNLTLPFGYLGIGRSNNFIENFHVVTVSSGEPSYKRYTPVIPNSQLKIHSDRTDKIKYDIRLMVQPTDKLSLIVASVMLVLMALGMTIVYLHINEEDLINEAEKKKFNLYY